MVRHIWGHRGVPAAVFLPSPPCPYQEWTEGNGLRQQQERFKRDNSKHYLTIDFNSTPEGFVKWDPTVRVVRAQMMAQMGPHCHRGAGEGLLLLSMGTPFLTSMSPSWPMPTTLRFFFLSNTDLSLEFLSTPHVNSPPHPCFPQSYAQTHGVILASVLPSTIPHSTHRQTWLSSNAPRMQPPLSLCPPCQPGPCHVLLPSPPTSRACCPRHNSQPRSGLQQPCKGPSHRSRTAPGSQSGSPAPTPA